MMIQWLHFLHLNWPQPRVIPSHWQGVSLQGCTYPTYNLQRESLLPLGTFPALHSLPAFLSPSIIATKTRVGSPFFCGWLPRYFIFLLIVQSHPWFDLTRKCFCYDLSVLSLINYVLGFLKINWISCDYARLMSIKFQKSP